MYRSVALLLFSFLPLLGFSHDGTDAFQRFASSFFGGAEVKNVAMHPNARRGVLSVSGIQSLHVFNLTDAPGFVILSGDAENPKIVGYSYDSHFNSEQISPSMNEFFESYCKSEEIAACQSVAFGKASASPAHVVVEPIVPSSWGQGEPYDAYSPVLEGEKCPVGCVATALSQVMFHYKWPLEAKGKVTYKPSNPGLDIIKQSFEGHAYDWASMKNTTWENLASPEAAEAVASLCIDCGYACKMDYGVGGSGAYPDLAMKALYGNFGYKASSLRYYLRDCFTTQEEWNAILKRELTEGRPILYSASSPVAGGHEFIIDGYDNEDFFHVNWGWDGQNNGFFAIDNLTPNSLSFSESHAMVCGISPDVTGEDTKPSQWQIYMALPPSVEESSARLGDTFVFYENFVFNMLSTKCIWAFAVGLFDLDGTLRCMVSDTEDPENETMLVSSFGYSLLGIDSAIPESTPDGVYVLKAMFKQAGYSDYIFPATHGGDAVNTIYVDVHDGKAYFNSEPPVSVEATVEDRLADKVQFYDLQGRKLTSPAKGSIVVKHITLPDGTVETRKFLAR